MYYSQHQKKRLLKRLGSCVLGWSWLHKCDLKEHGFNWAAPGRFWCLRINRKCLFIRTVRQC